LAIIMLYDVLALAESNISNHSTSFVGYISS